MNDWITLEEARELIGENFNPRVFSTLAKELCIGSKRTSMGEAGGSYKTYRKRDILILGRTFQILKEEFKNEQGE